MEAVAEVEVLPAVSVADGVVEFAVEAAEFEDAWRPASALPGISC